MCTLHCSVQCVWGAIHNDWHCNTLYICLPHVMLTFMFSHVATAHKCEWDLKLYLKYVNSQHKILKSYFIFITALVYFSICLIIHAKYEHLLVVNGGLFQLFRHRWKLIGQYFRMPHDYGSSNSVCIVQLVHDLNSLNSNFHRLWNNTDRLARPGESCNGCFCRSSKNLFTQCFIL